MTILTVVIALATAIIRFVSEIISIASRRKAKTAVTAATALTIAEEVAHLLHQARVGTPPVTVVVGAIEPLDTDPANTGLVGYVVTLKTQAGLTREAGP